MLILKYLKKNILLMIIFLLVSCAWLSPKKTKYKEKDFQEKDNQQIKENKLKNNNEEQEKDKEIFLRLTIKEHISSENLKNKKIQYSNMVLNELQHEDYRKTSGRFRILVPSGVDELDGVVYLEPKLWVAGKTDSPMHLSYKNIDEKITFSFYMGIIDGKNNWFNSQGKTLTIDDDVVWPQWQPEDCPYKIPKKEWFLDYSFSYLTEIHEAFKKCHRWAAYYTCDKYIIDHNELQKNLNSFFKKDIEIRVLPLKIEEARFFGLSSAYAMDDNYNAFPYFIYSSADSFYRDEFDLNYPIKGIFPDKINHFSPLEVTFGTKDFVAHLNETRNFETSRPNDFCSTGERYLDGKKNIKHYRISKNKCYEYMPTVSFSVMTALKARASAIFEQHTKDISMSISVRDLLYYFQEEKIVYKNMIPKIKEYFKKMQIENSLDSDYMPWNQILDFFKDSFRDCEQGICLKETLNIQDYTIQWSEKAILKEINDLQIRGRIGITGNNDDEKKELLTLFQKKHTGKISSLEEEKYKAMKVAIPNSFRMESHSIQGCPSGDRMDFEFSNQVILVNEKDPALPCFLDIKNIDKTIINSSALHASLQWDLDLEKILSIDLTPYGGPLRHPLDTPWHLMSHYVRPRPTYGE